MENETRYQRIAREQAERKAARLARMAKPRHAKREHGVASREEQHARYIDCGPGAWDDRGESPDY